MPSLPELPVFPENDYTDDGQLLGHIIIGTEMISDHIREIPGFPPKLASELKHRISFCKITAHLCHAQRMLQKSSYKAVMNALCRTVEPECLCKIWIPKITLQKLPQIWIFHRCHNSQKFCVHFSILPAGASNSAFFKISSLLKFIIFYE